jgi:ribonuclease R
MGHVEEILGRSGAPGMAVEIAIRNFDLPVDFPEAALEQADDLGEQVTAKQHKGRKDLRDLPLVTIDGADARDFDDAVYCSRNDKGWRLVVAIAAVAAYVKPGSPLDKEAINRGTSVYFPNRVIPMLPESLSNGLCSLKPEVDRLCMVCDMQVSAKGKVSRSRFYQAVMYSHARLTYGQAQEMLDRDDSPLRNKNAGVTESVDQLNAMYKAFRGQRQNRGAIDFHSTEVRFQFGANGEVSDIQPFHRHATHKIIEECMIAANVEAARFLQKHKIPAPYRVHESPPDGKLESLVSFLRGQGLQVTWKDKPTPRDLSALLKQVEDRPDRDLVEAVLLRSQSLAAYLPDNLGHFGLALDAYAHFTSPIRRYADLLVHRAIGHILEYRSAKKYLYDEARVRDLAERCSNADRRAEEASRDVDERLKAAYMEGHVGDVFPGIVTGVTSFGLFVELTENRVSGLLHVTALPNDYYNFDPVAHRLTGQRSGTVFHLADAVEVTVLAVNSEDRKVDFGWAGKNAAKS